MEPLRRIGSTRRPKPSSSPSHTKYSDPFTSAASTVRLVSFDTRRGSILDLLPDFNRGGTWKHGGSKRANTATRTFEKQSGGCGASRQLIPTALGYDRCPVSC